MVLKIFKLSPTVRTIIKCVNNVLGFKFNSWCQSNLPYQSATWRSWYRGIGRTVHPITVNMRLASALVGSNVLDASSVNVLFVTNFSIIITIEKLNIENHVVTIMLYLSLVIYCSLESKKVIR